MTHYLCEKVYFMTNFIKFDLGLSQSGPTTQKLNYPTNYPFGLPMPNFIEIHFMVWSIKHADSHDSPHYAYVLRVKNAYKSRFNELSCSLTPVQGLLIYL
jgi:hypothetical protein